MHVIYNIYISYRVEHFNYMATSNSWDDL